MKILRMALFVTTLFGAAASVQAADTILTVKGVKGPSPTTAAPKGQAIRMKPGESRTFIVDPEIMQRLDNLAAQLGELNEKYSSLSMQLEDIKKHLTQPEPSLSLPSTVVAEEEDMGWFESVAATIAHWWHSFWEWLGEHWQLLLLVLVVVALIGLLVRLIVWLRRPRKKFGPRREP